MYLCGRDVCNCVRSRSILQWTCLNNNSLSSLQFIERSEDANWHPGDRFPQVMRLSALSDALSS